MEFLAKLLLLAVFVLFSMFTFGHPAFHSPETTTSFQQLQAATAFIVWLFLLFGTGVLLWFPFKELFSSTEVSQGGK